MKFSGKMYLKIILKVTKNQGGFSHYLEDTLFEKPQGGSVKLTLPRPPPHPPPAFLGLNVSFLPNPVFPLLSFFVRNLAGKNRKMKIKH